MNNDWLDKFYEEGDLAICNAIDSFRNDFERENSNVTLTYKNIIGLLMFVTANVTNDLASKTDLKLKENNINATKKQILDTIIIDALKELQRNYKTNGSATNKGCENE